MMLIASCEAGNPYVGFYSFFIKECGLNSTIFNCVITSDLFTTLNHRKSMLSMVPRDGLNDLKCPSAPGLSML